MRIIGEIPHVRYKITVFAMNERLSVKIEDSVLEQVYKFRDGSGVKSMEDIKRFIDIEFLKSVDSIFINMRTSYQKGLQNYTAEEDDFMTII